ncbi:hypothetical protein ACS0PU_000869 [Formica fusca]
MLSFNRSCLSRESFASLYEKSGLSRSESMHAILSRLKFRVLCHFLGSSVQRSEFRNTIIGFTVNRMRCNRWRMQDRFDLASNLALEHDRIAFSEKNCEMLSLR